MFIIIGIMLTGMLFGYLLRSKRLTWIHKIITFLIWVLLFLLGIDVGGNDIIVKGLHTLDSKHLLLRWQRLSAAHYSPGDSGTYCI